MRVTQHIIEGSDHYDREEYTLKLDEEDKDISTILLLPKLFEIIEAFYLSETGYDETYFHTAEEELQLIPDKWKYIEKVANREDGILICRTAEEILCHVFSIG